MDIEVDLVEVEVEAEVVEVIVEDEDEEQQRRSLAVLFLNPGLLLCQGMDILEWRIGVVVVGVAQKDTGNKNDNDRLRRKIGVLGVDNRNVVKNKLSRWIGMLHLRLHNSKTNRAKMGRRTGLFRVDNRYMDKYKGIMTCSTPWTSVVVAKYSFLTAQLPGLPLQVLQCMPLLLSILLPILQRSPLILRWASFLLDRCFLISCMVNLGLSFPIPLARVCKICNLILTLRRGMMRRVGEGVLHEWLLGCVL